MVSSKWLCKNLSEEIAANQEVPVEALQKVAMERFRIKVKKRLLYKVKTMAKREIHGGFDESYGLLPRYAEMIKATNPGSYALVTWTGNTGAVIPKFKACFFAFAANVRGFIGGCRPLIGIDGAYLSGNYKGILLSALGIDGNNEIFLIAYGIVDTESTPSWTYFFRNLRTCFEKEGCKRDDWTFISDNEGYSGTPFHKLFWTVADVYNEFVFKKSMLKIHEYNLEAVTYLDSCTEQWSRHVFDPLVCCDHNTTNFVESFNACTKPYRDLPVFTLLEAIRNWSMKRIGPRFDKAVDMDVNMVTDYAKKILQTRSDESRCGCEKWQGCGIPCKHALRVIFDERLEAADFVSPYFKGAAYKATYGEHIHPIADPSHWPDHDLPLISPHDVKRDAGRPQKQRKRGPNEAKKGKRHNTVKCSKCKEVGHNARTCGGGPTAQTRKEKGSTSAATETEKRGRKRKETDANNASTSQPQAKKTKRKNKKA
ncbi:uncharacterized protein LOC125491684 [Beta vulgaris subsp. vulgaris]|uniref:uncharacterized protein LOC125491684 n=1 Tax=Beta vulgaris subsp. vulgaris TaxID=3555 RepID=UPI0025496D1D|nr:uncharacterized protein LOC125491684 [Beta vulgaris subsp. vulgaris]